MPGMPRLPVRSDISSAAYDARPQRQLQFFTVRSHQMTTRYTAELVPRLCIKAASNLLLNLIYLMLAADDESSRNAAVVARGLHTLESGHQSKVMQQKVLTHQQLLPECKYNQTLHDQNKFHDKNNRFAYKLTAHQYTLYFSSQHHAPTFYCYK